MIRPQPRQPLTLTYCSYSTLRFSDIKGNKTHRHDAQQAEKFRNANFFFLSRLISKGALSVFVAFNNDKSYLTLFQLREGCIAAVKYATAACVSLSKDDSWPLRNLQGSGRDWNPDAE